LQKATDIVHHLYQSNLSERQVTNLH